MRTQSDLLSTLKIALEALVTVISISVIKLQPSSITAVCSMMFCCTVLRFCDGALLSVFVDSLILLVQHSGLPVFFFVVISLDFQ